jgi:SAM-dependent methyltransferase
LKKTEQGKWFTKWFNTQDYLNLYKHRDARDAAKILKLLFANVNIPKGAKVLDLACGNGRHSLLIARKGYNVTGIDLSKYLISKAKEKLNGEYAGCRNKLKFEIGDMRNIGHINEFELVVNLFTSFGYFEKQSDNVKVIKSISSALRKNGWFLFDFLNRDYLLNHLVPFDIKRENKNIIVQIRNITNGFVEKNIFILKNNPAPGLYPVLNSYKEKIRLYSKKDFQEMFSVNGLKTVKVFGNCDGAKFIKTKSERLIILAQKI